jgi:hypothetical protein
VNIQDAGHWETFFPGNEVEVEIGNGGGVPGFDKPLAPSCMFRWRKRKFVVVISRYSGRYL